MERRSSGEDRRGQPTPLAAHWLVLAASISLVVIGACSSPGERRSPPRPVGIGLEEVTDSAWDVVLPDEGENNFLAAPPEDRDYRDTVFSRADTTVLRAALALADTVLADSQYLSIIRQLGEDDVVEWHESKIDRLPVAVRDSATQWLLGRYSRFGNYQIADLRARVPNNSKSLTRAWTRPCIRPSAAERRECLTALNILILREGDAGVAAVAGTLVHERMHTLWQVHAHGQKRSSNVCDAAYVMGDVAQALLVRRATAQPADLGVDICPAVQDRLEVLGVLARRDRR